MNRGYYVDDSKTVPFVAGATNYEAEYELDQFAIKARKLAKRINNLILKRYDIS